ncbi:Curved DNA-binding protein [Neolecta irregularis DAH-3]|uniref:Curved DNA-binding protein n=1 Tax=Neolecta irregularis (strain DAH-3) TaxID=1198029 RepID=A0A1U7LL55_NEOID|nr:Curved DNA-binding protein [Neolecta irregularis DAH-3]|eukprot:OLL23272.1 Curved DNA-binding protein [Neolecta irregularis DAH-3]
MADTSTTTTATVPIDKSADFSLANPDTLTKYKTASEISARVLASLKILCVDGANILELCAKGDSFLEEETAKVYKGKKFAKGIAFPTCISPNHIVCHFSPLPSDPESQTTIKTGDLLKISLGAQIDGFAGVLADTFVVPGDEDKVTGRRADVLMAAYLASEAAIRLIKPGAKNWEITDAVNTIAKAFDCSAVEGMLSHQQERNVIDGKKQIILNPTEPQRREMSTHIFEEGEIYGVDILVSTAEGKVRRVEARTTVFKKADITYLLKLKASRLVFSEIQKKFGAFPFTLRSLDDERKARMGVLECQQHGLLQPFDVLYEKDGEYVAQFFNTIALTKNGTVRLTGPPPLDLNRVTSEKTLMDDKLTTLIASSLKPSSKKKNKKNSDKATANGQASR